MKYITRVWSEHGFWKYSCGCIQYQDGYDLCVVHKLDGYQSLLRDTKDSQIEDEIKPFTLEDYNYLRSRVDMRTMTRRYYPGANIVDTAPILGTLYEAVEKAKQKLIKHPELEEVNIVEIVKVVRRKPVDIDIIVEDVR